MSEKKWQFFQWENESLMIWNDIFGDNCNIDFTKILTMNWFVKLSRHHFWTCYIPVANNLPYSALYCFFCILQLFHCSMMPANLGVTWWTLSVAGGIKCRRGIIGSINKWTVYLMPERGRKRHFTVAKSFLVTIKGTRNLKERSNELFWSSVTDRKTVV